MTKAPELQTNDERLTKRELVFNKWGRRWSITVYFRQPVSDEDRADANKILESFRFAGVPSDDDIWAVGQARKYLPAEAQADKYFTTNAGSILNYYRVERLADEIYVTFTRVDPNNRTSKREWRYQVTNTGEVIRILTPQTPTPKQNESAAILPNENERPIAKTYLQIIEQ